MKDGFAQLNINEKATVDQKHGMSSENLQPARTGRKEKKKQKSIRSRGRVKGQGVNEGMQEEREFNLSIARVKIRLRVWEHRLESAGD